MTILFVIWGGSMKIRLGNPALNNDAMYTYITLFLTEAVRLARGA